MVAFSTSYGEQKLERQQISRQDQGGGASPTPVPTGELYSSEESII